jgi:hypothetical protein
LCSSAGRSSFLKKRTKKLLIFLLRIAETARDSTKKFFASFFKKEALPFFGRHHS